MSKSKKKKETKAVIAGQSKPLLIYGKPEAQQASGE